MSFANQISTKQDLRELLLGHCDPDDLGRLTDWGWHVVINYAALERILNDEFSVTFPPGATEPVIELKNPPAS
jgi:hypothetical protein